MQRAILRPLLSSHELGAAKSRLSLRVDESCPRDTTCPLHERYFRATVNLSALYARWLVLYVNLFCPFCHVSLPHEITSTVKSARPTRTRLASSRSLFAKGSSVLTIVLHSPATDRA